jgi:hypothetical protein
MLDSALLYHYSGGLAGQISEFYGPDKNFWSRLKPNWVLGMPLFLPSFLLLLFFIVSDHNSWILASSIA